MAPPHATILWTLVAGRQALGGKTAEDRGATSRGGHAATRG